MVDCCDYWHLVDNYSLLNECFNGTLYLLYVKRILDFPSLGSVRLHVSLARSTCTNQGKQTFYRVHGLWFEITIKPNVKQ